MKVKKLIIKIVIVLCIVAVLGVGMWHTMKALNIDSLDGLQKIVNKYGIWAYLIIGLIEVLQVIFLPISTTIVIGFAVACCGTWEAFFLSWIAISIGDIILHFIGRGAGGKLLSWLLSDKETAEKIKKMLTERKLFFTVSMLNPIIPDEITMVLTGTCKINTIYCIIVAILTRAIVIICQVFAFDLLFNNWWGILIVVVFFAFMIFASIMTFKKGEQIEKWFFSLFKKQDCTKCKFCAKMSEEYGDYCYCFKKNETLKYNTNKCKHYIDIKGEK